MKFFSLEDNDEYNMMIHKRRGLIIECDHHRIQSGDVDIYFHNYKMMLKSERLMARHGSVKRDISWDKAFEHEIRDRDFD